MKKSFIILFFIIFSACTVPFYESEMVDPGELSSLQPDVVGNVSASDGTYSDKVLISWSSVNNASGYSVYKYDATGAFIEKLDPNIAEDPEAIPTIKYQYAVIAESDAGYTSDLSVKDVGYRTMNADLLPMNTWLTDTINSYDKWYYFNGIESNEYFIDTKNSTYISVYRENLHDFYIKDHGTSLNIIAINTEKVYIRLQGFPNFVIFISNI